MSRAKEIATFNCSKTLLLLSPELQSLSKYFLELFYKMPEAPMKIGRLEEHGVEESSLKLKALY